MKIFTIGETTYDILFRNGQPVSGCSGGSAYNSAVSLGRCGLPVSLITTFGNDKIGDFSMSFLKANGVNCDLIKRFEGRSRVALAFFDCNENADYSFYPASEDSNLPLLILRGYSAIESAGKNPIRQPRC